MMRARIEEEREQALRDAEDFKREQQRLIDEENEVDPASISPCDVVGLSIGHSSASSSHQRRARETTRE